MWSTICSYFGGVKSITVILCNSVKLFINFACLFDTNTEKSRFAEGNGIMGYMGRSAYPENYASYCPRRRIEFCRNSPLLNTLWVLVIKVPVPKSLENEFSLSWQILSLFLPIYHPW